MRIERLHLQPYRLPLRRPWRSARGVLSARSGWWLRIESRGLFGEGDCAPLPEAGTEMPEAAERRLCAWMVEARGASLDVCLARLATEGAGQTPSAHQALECALLDLKARARGLPLRQLLNPASPAMVAVNAMLGPLGPESPATARVALEAGFRVLKLKVGTQAPEQEVRWLHRLAQDLPRAAALRLDANGAWSEALAGSVLDALDGLPIESIEEPLDLGGLDEADASAALARLQARTPIALARDESLAWLDPGLDPGLDPELDPGALGVRRLVLKPGALGGARATLHLAERAHAAGLEVVVTSLIESAVGLWTVAQIAAASASPLAHGLATADWLAEDLGEAPRPEQGVMRLGSVAGSGFRPTRRAA